MPRVLLIGYGKIGREMFPDYAECLSSDVFMVVDPRQQVPAGYEWDGAHVDLACIVVDTPMGDAGTYDYSNLLAAVEEWLPVSDFVLVRSTVGLDFLTTERYRNHADMIGFSPEFYGTTQYSRRGAVPLHFSIFSSNVPKWFTDRVAVGEMLTGSPAEVIVAKLAENAFLATKVTFFHELFQLCETHGVGFESVRRMVTRDPRITAYHSMCDGNLGWSSHCFDKDVPAYAELAGDGLVRAVLNVNRSMLG